MTVPAVPPLIVPAVPTLIVGAGPLPRRHRPEAARRGLPLAVPPPRRFGNALYGMATMDARGRLAEQTVVRGLGWSPGAPTAVRVVGGLVLVAGSTEGVNAVTTDCHLRVPATVRHRLGLRPGDRVLLVGRPAEAVVILYPPAALDAVLAGPAADPSGEPA